VQILLPILPWIIGILFGGIQFLLFVFMTIPLILVGNLSIGLLITNQGFGLVPLGCCYHFAFSFNKLGLVRV